jgi:predicted Zn-dependent protease
MTDLKRTLDAAAGYLTLGLIDDAWEELESLPPAMEREDAVLELRCEIYQRLGRWNSARVLAESMAHRSPENPAWWLSWAYALRREQSVEAARGVLWEAAQLHPGVPLITYNLACYASVLGELDEARRLLAKSFAMDPGMKKIAGKDPDLTPVFRDRGII